MMAPGRADTPVERYGLSRWRRLRPKHLIRKVEYEARKRTARWTIPRSPLQGQSFVLWGGVHRYWLAAHNTTWRNERSVELPVAVEFVRAAVGPVLEVGDVLSHYVPADEVPRKVVDRYTRRRGVLNVDVLDYEPSERFDRIVSISTIEHIGWDEVDRSPRKSIDAIEHLRRLLLPNGRLLITAALGYNPYLDAYVSGGARGVERQAILQRADAKWTQQENLEIVPYLGRHGRGATSVWIAELLPWRS